MMDYQDVILGIRGCGMTMLPAVLMEVVSAAKREGSFENDAAMVLFVERYLNTIDTAPET